uniref:Uncharacterized protein n=1 Tax=Rhizophora mucronata TaxID=61149 RepID=A0A2P2QHV6_RHIMU
MRGLILFEVGDLASGPFSGAPARAIQRNFPGA